MSGRISKDKLLLDLTRTHGFSAGPAGYILAERVIAYCRQNHQTDPYDDLIEPIYFGGGVAAPAYIEWTAQPVRDFFAAKLVTAPASVWANPRSLAFVDAAKGIISASHVATRSNTGGFLFYRIVDDYYRVVEVLQGKRDDIEIAIAEAIAPTMNAAGLAVCHEDVRRIMQAFQYHAARIAPPTLHGQLGDPHWTLNRATIVPDPNMLFPAWRMFLDRLNDPAAYAAWHAGVYYGLNKGRQVLWVSDGESGNGGLSGKSATTTVIQDACYGPVGHSLGAKTILENPHTSASFEGKRFVAAGDNANPAIIHSTLIKELSGDDKTLINAKYKMPESVRLQCRVQINGNCSPIITSEDHNVSRTLFLELAKLHGVEHDAERYPAQLRAELPGFLAYGLEQYKLRCRNNFKIETNTTVQAAVALRIAESEDKFSEPFHEFFVEDRKAQMTGKEWRKVIAELRFNQYEEADFKRYIKRTCNVSIVLAGRGYRFVGMRRRKSTDTFGARPPGQDALMPGAQ